MKLFILSLMLCVLSGCATSEVSVETAKQVPNERLFIKNNVDGNAVITIIRDSGFLGSGCNINVFINEELAATLDVSEKATFNVKAGEMFLGLQLTGSGLCISSSLRQSETSIKKGQHKIYRVALEPSGSMAILPSGFYK
ncbi:MULTISPECIES: hypothetical protein [unclassified Shewanella]|uniref:hypothetical protein n=1 Tax=Shewanella TaxID=22 RepID=UPI0021D91C9F|nr:MULTISPECIES: hypothetical protein [unclassified Shewanella]MCU8044391.1 hypothetical protein [Shewanella sp. SM68]MCU8048473.1 hypothetical protein [Shewanella sp. SM65]